MKIRFHLDEQMPRSLALGLRRRGVDVTTSHDANLLGANDPDQLAFAASAKRVLVTHDADFLRIARLEISHAGIAYCHSEKFTTRQLQGALLQLADCVSAEAIQGQVHFL
jgi:predicted nuclease of predicted toxin-antitoxin system